MVDDKDLEGLDPYELMATEAQRLDRFFSGLSGDGWSRPSRCEGWSVRDVLAHLGSSEGYNQACLGGTVAQFLADMGAKGASDLATVNDLGIHEFDGQEPAAILTAWRTRATDNRETFRARDGGNVDSSVGEYPARWQAFHLSFELATHADDVHVPVPDAEAVSRVAWQARFGRFALKELRDDVDIEAHDGRTRVRIDDVDVDLTDDLFVKAVAARLPDDSGIDAEAAAALSATP
jgi:uncharacterized protein (TIGR03083 family)